MATLESIQAKIAKLQTQATALATTKSTAVLEKIRGLMEKHSVTLTDIEAFVGKRRGRKPGVAAAAKQSSSAAKYADPKTGATWTGHGRAPSWIANAKDRSKFLVAGGAAKSAASVKEASRAGNYIRGPQPALFRNPKTDETWSGRGRAPAWIAGAKDRTKFLIAKAEEPAAATKTKAEKAAPAKKGAAKKTTVKSAPAKKVPGKKAAAPAGRTARKNGAAAKSPVGRKARAPKSSAKSAAPVEAVVPQATTEAAGTPAAA